MFVSRIVLFAFARSVRNSRPSSVRASVALMLLALSVPALFGSATPPLRSITLAPVNGSMPVNMNQAFTATGTYADGSTGDLTNSVTWASSVGKIATIANSPGLQGIATAKSAGTTSISASFGGITVSTNLTVTNATLQSIAMQPASATTKVNLTVQFKAVGTFSDGSTYDVTQTVDWTSSDTSVATVKSTGASSGTAAGVGAGTAIITASYTGAIPASASLKVDPAATIQTMTVTPANVSIPLGLTQQFKAVALFSDSTTMDVTSSATWSSSSAGVAAISNGGLATSKGAGQTTIAATLNKISGSTVLTVTPALVSISVSPSGPSVPLGLTDQFTATGQYSDGSVRDLTSLVTWASGNTAVAVISAQGLAATRSTGTTGITASYAGLTSAVDTFTVLPPALVSIIVTPGNPSIPLGTSQQFAAIGNYTDHSEQNITASVSWSSSATGVATIASSGVATSTGQGTTTITAMSGSINASTVLTVAPPALVSIAVTPANASIPLGKTQQFAATGTYTDKTTRDLTTTVAWTSSAQAIATVAGGLATSVGQGSTTITATSGTITGSTTLTITAPTLVSISVTPASASVPLGKTQQFTATGTYTNASTQDLTASATWTSSVTTVASVASGLATSAAQGSTTITATSGSISGSTILTVTAPALVSIAVSPANPVIAIGATQQFKATGSYTDQSTQDITSGVAWNSSAPAVASVNTSGVATSTSAGYTTIQATSGAISGSTSLAVTAFTPTASLITSRQQFTATQLTSGKILIVGGSAPGAGPFAAAELYDPVTKAFSPAGNLVTGRYAHTATLLPNGKVLIAGGMNNGWLNSAEIYDPTTRIFTATGSMSTPRAVHTATPLNNGLVLIAGGVTNGATDIASTEIYDPAAGSFKPGPTMSTPHANHTATVLLNGKVLVAGGPWAAADLYDPATGTFSQAGSLASGGQNLAATLLNSGKVLFTGGNDAGSILATAQLYDPATNAFTSTGSMAVAREYHTSTLLTNGQVLVAGGYNGNGNIGNAELYDPVTGTFTSAGPMNTTRSVHDAVLLPNGQVLIVGGANLSGAVAVAELYQPSSLTPPGLVSVKVTPSNPSIAAGAVQAFTAIGQFSDNSTQTLSSVIWSSSAAAVATISNDPSNLGVSFGVAPGMTTITATAGSVSGSTSLTIKPVLVSLSIDPASPAIPLGLTQQFTATGKYSDGSTQDLTSSVVWNSSAPAVATVSKTGVATGIALGTANITAAAGSINGTAILTVTAPVLTSIAVTPANPSIPLGKTQQFTATGTYSNGTTQDLTATATWTSSTSAVATISSTGSATSAGPGSTTITAVSGSIAGSTTLTVTGPTLVSLSIGTPYGPSARSGYGMVYDSIRSKVILFGGADANGNYLNDVWEWDNVARTWNNVTPASGSMPIPRASFGMAYDPNRGKVVIYGGKVSNQYSNVGITGDTWEWDCAAHTWTQFPQADTIVYAGLFGADLAYDPNLKQVILFGGRPYWFNPDNGLTYAWNGSNWNQVANTGPAGRIQHAMITDTARSKVIVYGGGSSGYDSNGSPQTTPRGDTWEWNGSTWVQVASTGPGARTGAAFAFDASRGRSVLFGGAINGSTLAQDTWEWDGTTWSQRNTSGTPSARRSGMSFDLARKELNLFGGDTGAPVLGDLYSASLDSSGVLAFSSRASSNAVITLGQTQQFTAVGKFSDGSTQNVTAAWSSASPAVATVTSAGLVTGAALGSTQITAMSGSLSAAANVTVVPPVLVSISITPANATIVIGGNLQLTATGSYSDGSTKDITASVTWTSIGPSVATVSSTGLATGVAPGTAGVSAALGTVTGSTLINVTAPVLTAISVTPANPSIAAGFTQQFTATGTYSNGSKQDITNSVTWSSSVTAVATITAGGLATVTGVGSTAIQAASGSVTGSTILTGTSPFTATGSMSTSRYQHTATLLNNGSVFIAGGQLANTGPLASTELYSVSTGQFTIAGNMIQSRRNHTATLLPNGKVLLAGGYGYSGDMNDAEIFDPATGTFTPTGSMNFAREAHTATLLPNGRVLIAGGANGSSLLSSAELYDPSTGIFTALPNMNAARTNFTATLLNNGKVLIAGGGAGNGVVYATAELFDPATGTFTPAGSMSTPRLDAGATLLNNGNVLISGGGSASAEIYDPNTGTFTPTGSMSTSRRLGLQTLLNNGNVLVTGGYLVSNGTNVYLNSAEIYDPAAGRFTPAGTMTAGRYVHTATLLNDGRVLLAGGYESVASAELYTPATLVPPFGFSLTVSPANGSTSSSGLQSFVAVATMADGTTQRLTSVTWSSSAPSVVSISNDGTDRGTAAAQAPGSSTITASAGPVTGSTTLTIRAPGFVMDANMITGRWSHTATLLNNGKVLIAGGANAGSTAETYDPATKKFSATGNMTTARLEHTATLLMNGTVLLTGGFNGSTALASAEVYDPSTGTFTPAGSMSGPRTLHTATLLKDGTVLIAGGYGIDGNNILGTAEIYNPATGTFTAVANMTAVRVGHTATLLQNGKVLIAGGRTGALNGIPTASAEIYDPAIHAFTTIVNMSAARRTHTSTLLANGKVLIAGGTNDTITLNTAEIFDPSTGTFSVAPNMTTPRYYHTASRLSNGTVLLAGGYNGSAYTATAEVYDPMTGVFTATANMSSARGAHTATLLNNAEVLLAGGIGAVSPATTERY